ncbi:MAG: hypothetical protein ACPGJS_00440 [Flammeovirgaceae bacterium]
MKVFKITFLIIIISVGLNAQSTNNKLTIDSNFVYSKYIYKNGQMNISTKKAPHLFENIENYQSKGLRVFDGMWTADLRKCLCEVDLERKKFIIKMPKSYPKLQLTFNRFLEVNGTIDYDGSVLRDPSLITGSLYPDSLDKIVLSINQNPLSSISIDKPPHLFMNRILEGYGLLFRNNTQVHPIIFRCFINIKGESNWNIKMAE